MAALRQVALAVTLCLFAPAHARLYSASYTEVKYDDLPIKWNGALRAAIPDGQCTGLIDVSTICRDKNLPIAIAWEVKLNDTWNPFIRITDLQQAEILRSEKKYPPVGACAGAVVVSARAYCVQYISPNH